MKKLITRYQDGGSLGEQLVDAGQYMVPVYGTYLSFKDAINDPSWANWGLAGLSLVGDVGTVLGGSGLVAKGISAGSKASKFAKAAKITEKEAQMMAKHAEKLAPLSGKYYTYTEIPSSTGKTVLHKVAPAKFVEPWQQEAVLRTINGIFADAEGTMRKAITQEGIADTYRKTAMHNMKLAGRIAAGGTAVKGGKSLQKASELGKPKLPDKQKNYNLVEKRKTPYLYNTFQKRQGGTIVNLIPKHLLGNSLRLRSQRTLDYFRDNIFPYLEWVEARNLSGKNWDNYTWTGKPVREYDDSGDPASYNPYLTTMVPVKNSLGQNGFLEVNPYFFDGYQETFHPENGEDSWYPKIKEDYDKLMKSGWNSREWAKDHSWHPLTHYRKYGGLLTKRTLLKYLTGGTFRFGGEYFTFPEGSLNQLQLEFLNKYQDKKYQGPFGASDEDEYEFYLGWEKAFGPYEPSNSTYGGYYIDDSGNVKKARYSNNLWSVDTTKYKVYTTPLNYSKDNGYYFKVGDNMYKGGRYR